MCSKHGPFVDLDRHCHNITRFFIFEEDFDSNISSWFQIASGITEVKYISDLHDGSMFQCGPTMEYEEAKSKFHSQLIKELTRFSFIWGGFEAFLDTLKVSTCKVQPGKINNVNHFLKENYEGSFPMIEHYSDVVQYIKTILTKNPWHGEVENLFSEGKCASSNLIGLKVVYKIRNSFAHGALQFSEPGEWNSTKPFDTQLIMASSRIVLFTIQMLLISTNRNLNFKIAELHESVEEAGIKAKKYVPKMHLRNFQHS